MGSCDASGYISKWTNVIKGYQKRWFMLHGSLLSYYRNPEAVGRRCRGTFDLKNATIDVGNTLESFKIIESSGRKHHLKALSLDDRNKWLKVLSDAITAASRNADGESDSLSEDSFVLPSLSRSSSGNNRRCFVKTTRSHRSQLESRQLSSPNLPQVNYRNRKANKISLSNSSAPIFRADTVDPTRTRPVTLHLTEPSIVSKFENYSKDAQLDANFTCLIKRLRRSSITMEVAALNELISSVDTFRSRLKQHTDALCSQLSAIESTLTVPGVETVLANRPGASNLCPSCRQAASPGEADGTAQRLRLALGEHRQCVKEFQETCLDALQFLVANIERWHRRIISEQERCVGLERTVEQLARQHRALELQLTHCYAPLNDVSSENMRESHGGTLRKGATDFDVAGRKTTLTYPQSLDGPDDEQFFDAHSSLDTQPSSSPSEQHQLTLTQHHFRLPPPDEALAALVSLNSLPDVDESSCSDSSSEEPLSSEFPTPSQPASFVLENEPLANLPKPAITAATSPTRTRRTTIGPSPNVALNLWSVIKNAIGKDLTKIPLPVNFNEPISFLQRATEDLTYSELLDKASVCRDPADQMAWVAAFSISCYASTATRTGKPFNPLLGETYELDRSNDPYGWRLVAEQVSHHPPGSAVYCESTKHGWKLWFEFVLVSKFRGKYMSIFPKGIVNLLLPDGSRYTWSKATTIVHNLIVGTLWIDNCGDVLIRNHTNGFQCPLRFIAHSYFSRGPQRQVTGFVQTSSGVSVRSLQGCWDSYIESQAISPDNKALTEPVVLWRAKPLPPGADKIYNFSQFTVELNEPEPRVAPTDSRLRPDQRLMEEGEWDEANKEKRRLEQKQRAKRHQWEERQASGIQPLEPLFTPLWFAPALDPVTGEQSHVYLGNYWQAKSNQDWNRCPDIF